MGKYLQITTITYKSISFSGKYRGIYGYDHRSGQNIGLQWPERNTEHGTMIKTNFGSEVIVGIFYMV